MGLFDLFKKKTVREIIIKKFYSDYPVIPYISEERTEDWLERAELFPKASIIPKSMMKRYADGLLPGHIYMLYWLKKYTNKKVPTYFEYKYGIDFEKEKAFLLAGGYLDEMSKPTEKGEKAIAEHQKVIDNHTPPKTNSSKADLSIESISKQIISLRDNIRKNGYDEYEYMANRNCCKVCATLNGKHFRLSDLTIGVNAPPMHEGCSCSIAAYSNDDDYKEWLNSISKGKK